MWIVVYLITWLVGFQCTELNMDLPRLTGAALPIRLATIRLPKFLTYRTTYFRLNFSEFVLICWSEEFQEVSSGFTQPVLYLFNPSLAISWIQNLGFIVSNCIFLSSTNAENCRKRMMTSQKVVVHEYIQWCIRSLVDG